MAIEIPIENATDLTPAKRTRRIPRLRIDVSGNASMFEPYPNSKLEATESEIAPPNV